MSSSDNANDIESGRQRELEERFAREAEEARKKKEEQKADEPAILKPTNVLDEQDRGIFFPKDKYPAYSQDEYNRYLSYQRGRRQKWIAEDWSKRTNWVIPLYQNNGGPDNDPLLDPDKPFTTNDAEHVKSVAIEQKQFDFHDASVKHFNVLQKIDEVYTEAVQEIQNAVLNSPRGGIPIDEFKRLSENLRNAEEKRYRYGSRLFLHMTDDEYSRAVNLQNIKDAVDAAIHRTAHSIPNYTKTSSAGSSSIQ